MTNRFVSFFEKVGGFFKSLFGKAPTLAQQISAAISYIAPIAESILALVDPAAAPLAQQVVTEVESALATVKTVVAGATVAPGSTTAQTVQAALNSISTNISSLLSAAEIKNSAKVNEITAATTAIIGEVDAILSNLGGIEAGTPAAAA